MTEKRESECPVQNFDDETLDGFPNSDLKDVSKSETSSESLSGNKLVEEAEDCVICFRKFSEKIGSPDSCNHFFCLDCISEWAKSKNTCPLDRKTFSRIELFEKREGQIQRSGEDCLDISPKYETRRFEDVYSTSFEDFRDRILAIRENSPSESLSYPYPMPGFWNRSTRF